jgi:hypothetical protein
MTIKTGGCLCGAIRYEVEGADRPDRELPLWNLSKGPCSRLRNDGTGATQRVSMDSR